MGIELSTPPVLITGSTGFLGRHIVEQIHARGHNLLHISRDAKNLNLGPNDRVLKADLSRQGHWQELICKIKATVVIHCAGITSGTAEELYNANVVGFQNLTHALGNDAHYILASSGAIYGDTSLHKGANETFLPNPLSEYAKSKFAQELMLTSNCRNYSIMRLSNLIGPNQSRNFFVGNCINQILEFRQNNKQVNTLTVGDLSPTRDFIDCRDAANAIALVLENKPQGVFNLSSGKSELLFDVLEYLVKISRIHINIEINNRLGKNPIKHQRLNNSALQGVISWRPNIKMDESLSFALEASDPPSINH